MDPTRPIDLLRNLKQLIELDAFFEVHSLPRPPASAEASPAGQAKSGKTTSTNAATATLAEPTAASEPAPSRPHPLVAVDVPSSAPEALATIAQCVSACEHCGLCAQRTNTVPGEGSAQPEIMFIGEGPGADEDRQGRPFVGAAGQLLDKMIVAMGLQREQVFIANIVKCRPPGNRTPEADEIAACLPYLEAQVDALQPKIICTLGNTPLRALTGDERAGITRQRGQVFSWRGFQCIPTFHPSYLLRNEAAKKPTWDDLKQVLAAIGREPPQRR